MSSILPSSGLFESVQDSFRWGYFSNNEESVTFSNSGDRPSRRHENDFKI